MPIAGGNPKIVLDAYVDKTDFDAKVKALESRLNDTQTKLAQQASQSSRAAQTSTASWTEFRSMYSTVLDVVRVGQAVWDETGQKYVDNAIKVGNMARALGTSTEEASRLKEVADDVGISVTSLTTSFRAAQKDGIEPNIAGLAQLSDEYLSLAPGVERTQFLLDKFGKSGEEMGKLLEKGSASINQMASAIDEAQIVTQEGYEQARQYEISVDALKDSWDALTYKAAPPLIKATQTVIDVQRDAIRAQEILNDQGLYGLQTWDKRHRAALEQAKAEREAADATLLAADAAKEAAGAFETEAEMSARLAEEAKIAADAVKMVTDINKTLLGTIDNIQGAEEKYTERKQELAEERLKIAGWDIASLDENTRKQEENQRAFEEANLAILDGLVERKLMQDGVLTDDELNWLIDQREAWGIYSAEVADKARAVIKEADAITAAIANIPTNKDVSINVHTNYSSAATDLAMNQGSIGHAEGGNFMIPQSYAGESFPIGPKDTAQGGEGLSIIPVGGATNEDVVAAIQGIQFPTAAQIGKAVAMAAMQHGSG